MKVGVFYNGDETIVVGINQDGSPMDSDKTLFGPDSGRHLEDYDCKDVDIESGEAVIILSRPMVSVV